jgi:hypothetical protein
MRPAKFLMQSEVERAIKNTKSNAQAARFLNVNYQTYKKYASQYKDKEGNSIFEQHKNQSGLNISKPRMSIRNEKYKVEDILNNQHIGYPLQRLKDRLVLNGHIKEECEQCGFNEKRITDQRTPFLLSFKDVPDDYSIENLTLLCFNCHFLTVGGLSGKRKEFRYILKNY